jgi:hypothetical protein
MEFNEIEREIPPSEMEGLKVKPFSMFSRNITMLTCR